MSLMIYLKMMMSMMGIIIMVVEIILILNTTKIWKLMIMIMDYKKVGKNKDKIVLYLIYKINYLFFKQYHII